MGKYMDEAGAFSQGMTMVETALTDALDKLNGITFPDTGDATDSLTSNTKSSKEMITGSITELLSTISTTKTSIAAKAKEIDDRLYQEELARKKKLLEETIDAAIE